MIPEGAFTTAATLRAFIDEHNASLPALLSADDIKVLLEEYNATLPPQVPLGANLEETAQNYMALPADFQRIDGDQKQTATAMKACIKEYNATLPPPVKTSGSRDALLEQLAIINPDLVAQEAQKPAPLKVSGIKPETADRLSGTQILGAPVLPAVVLGVYTPDEIEQRTEKEINPTPQRVSLADISGDTVTTTQSAQESSVNVDSLADDFRERIESAQDVDSAKSLRADIETAKATLGSALFSELKNKAVKRYYLVDARNKVEEAIKSLPQPDEPHAAERFAEAERMLASSKRHLGDELHDQFSITLADMKPEYVA
ncbi:putative phage exodeoxyribonuclease [Escherichia coli]|uniref:Putative phage exodeoxyribonuclease n=1 Tax=Escherichia coli TaxID=562 RepID=A0A377BHZ2_ECOLX|nr:putative phage exodeoxyribonuclease [Escherichia coli]